MLFSKTFVTVLIAACAAVLPLTAEAAPAAVAKQRVAGPSGFSRRTLRRTTPVVPRSHHLSRRDLDASCSSLFGSGFTNPAPGQPLFVSGDSWIQGFQAPATGSICSLSIGTAPEANVTVVAQLALYRSTTAQSDILAGTATPFAAANSTLPSLGTIISFTFCGNNSASVVSGEAVTLVVTLEQASVASGSLVLYFEQSAAFGLFFGPTQAGQSLSVLNQGLTFNVTMSSQNKTVCDTTSSTTTSATSTATSTVTPVTFTLTSTTVGTGTTTATTTDFTTTATTTGSTTTATTTDSTTTATTTGSTTTATTTDSTTTATTTATTLTSTLFTVSTTSSSASASSTSTTCRSRDTSTCSMDGAWDTCASALTYANCVGSPTLSLCQTIACSTDDNLDERLASCAALDSAARANVGGFPLIPCRW